MATSLNKYEYLFHHWFNNMPRGHCGHHFYRFTRRICIVECFKLHCVEKEVQNRAKRSVVLGIIKYYCLINNSDRCMPQSIISKNVAAI